LIASASAPVKALPTNTLSPIRAKLLLSPSFGKSGNWDPKPIVYLHQSELEPPFGEEPSLKPNARLLLNELETSIIV
jgi:hypothetical protein